MPISRPIPIRLEPGGVRFAESVHAADFRMAPRADPFHKLVFALSGAVAYAEGAGGTETPLRAGELVAVPRGARHVFRDLESPTLLLLCLDEAFVGGDAEIERLWSGLAARPGQVLRPDRPSRLRLETVWRQAMLEQGVARAGAGCAVRALATQALVLLARLTEPDAAKHSEARVAAVIREVDESFFEPWNLDRASTRAGLSRRRFSALFRAATGKTFWDHLNDRRLDHAARLLGSGEHSILGAVFQCGFGDLSHFYRQFRARFGRPPGEWQEVQSAKPRLKVQKTLGSTIRHTKRTRN